VRIGLVCPYSFSSPGGVQGQVLELGRALRQLGHGVGIVAPGEAVPDEGVLPDTGVTGVGVTGVGVTGVGGSHRFRVNGSVAPMAPGPFAARRARRWMKQGDFDVLHLHEPLAPSITIAALVSHPAPLVGTFHAAGERTPYRWVGPALRPLAKRVDARVAVSGSAERLARKHLGGNYETLFNGVDLGRFRSVDRVATERPTILFLGRHEPRKGLGVLLEALSSLPDDIELWVGGAGRDHLRLRHRYRHDRRIRWLGPLTEHEKLRRLRSASVLCAPSLHGESFGLVVLEAMAAGTPVVASDVEGYRELSDGGRAALLVPPGDVPALAAGLSRVLHDPQRAHALLVAGDQRAAGFSMDALARRYVEIYERIA